MKKILVTVSAATMLTACSTTKKAEEVTPDVTSHATARVIGTGSVDPGLDQGDLSLRPSGDLSLRPSSQALAHVVIYKTKADYSNLVPVTMNRERTKVVSYPAKSDIRPSAKPVALADGWYLDRRGIGPNTVFTDYTYDEYSSLEKTPSASQLIEHIIEKYPLLELRDCGTESLTTEQLNELIRAGFKK